MITIGKLQLLILAMATLCWSSTFGQTSTPSNLTYEQALSLSTQNNPTLRIAADNFDAAKRERGSLRSTWFPQISAAGAYTHMSNYIGLHQKLDVYTNPIKDALLQLFPDIQLGPEILDFIGSQTLEYPLIERNFATIDVNLMWPVFTGGKRLFADKIGRSTVEGASIDLSIAKASVTTTLVERYFGLRLYKKISEIRKQSLESITQHYNQALSLSKNGMLNRAELLYAQLSKDEAEREYETSLKNLSVIESALKTTLGSDSLATINPTTPMFMLASLPPLTYFDGQAESNSYIIQQIDSKRNITKQLNNVEKSAYFPNIAFVARQNLYSYQLSRYVFPRTMLGVGFTWTLFDGLARERNISKTRIIYQSTATLRDKATKDINLGIKELYTKMVNAHNELSTIITSQQLAQELVKVRSSSFKEGMATSTEVVDAQLMLAKVDIAFMQAFYQYDLALIQLCSLCGIPDQFDIFRTEGITELQVQQQGLK